MNRDHFTSALAVMFALMMMTGSVAGAGVAGPTERVSPAADNAVGFTGYNLPEETVHHSVNGKAQPGIFVTVNSREDLNSLEQWANASSDRRVVERYNASNTSLIAAPMTDVQAPFASVERWAPSGGNSLSELGYVTGWDLNVQVQNVEPVTNLATEDEHQKPTGATAAEVSTSGKYTASAMAWSDDVNETHVSETHTLLGADGLPQSGQGVNVSVIDSGVMFGNGTLYGNGNSGSDMRVADAHDYVDGESVNLSVNRSELPNELDKMADPNGHGSWVSSATLNARSGVAPNATLHAYRTLNDEGKGSTSDIKSAIARSDRTGADIIVMSLGSPTHSDELANELRRVLGPDGNVTAVYVAVGNSYPLRVSSPADVDAVISVQATNAGNATTAKKAYFGNSGPDNGLDGSGVGAMNTHGQTPDTATIGMKVATPVFTSTDDVSPSNRTLSGTSMATPLAAGAGALLLEAEPTLEGNATAFHDRVVNSGTHTTQIGVTESEGGMVNATRAINGYEGKDAPDRDLPSDTEGRDAANQFLAGSFGQKVTAISEGATGIAG